MILPVTLTAAGIAALINFWLAMRVGRTRGAANISIGDGGHEPLVARMRAQANFVEYTPFVLILIGLIELAEGTSAWLWAVALVYLLGRVAHGLGMGADARYSFRRIGTLTTMLILIGLAIYAITLPYLADGRIMTTGVLQSG